MCGMCLSAAQWLSALIVDHYHIRIIKAYITFHMKRTPDWDPKVVTRNTPYDIRLFISQKCGPMADGYEGRKVSPPAGNVATDELIDLCPLHLSSQLQSQPVQPLHYGIALSDHQRVLLSGE
jgi:hypothetical protein